MNSFINIDLFNLDRLVEKQEIRDPMMTMILVRHIRISLIID